MNWRQLLPPYLSWSRDDKPEPDESVAEAVRVLKQRDQARLDARRAQGHRDLLGVELDETRKQLGLANADIYMLREVVADLRRQLANREEREPADVEAKRWKRRSEQDRENCHTMQKVIDDLRAELQALEVEYAWVISRNLVDPAGADKVRAATARVTGRRS